MKKIFKKVRCDNSGEDKTIKENCAKNFEEIKFEFTSPGTPQKNGVVERGFATLYSLMHAIMEHAGMHENLKTGLWSECASTATKLENIVVKPHEEKCPYEKFYRKIPYYAKYLRTFGEMLVVRIIDTVKEKPEDQVKMCMFLGYTKNHTDSTYRMLNLCTKRIVLSRDVIWLNKNYVMYV